ncbi:hypothetical protein EV191_1011018 [Tamaricihabitans halophyticus]|uniref:Lipoprotein LpqN n=1 Tax=Tamaricihabitans halophyticus TaxID=1262583 RepID=A0A4V6NRG5_9PSEU|nr:hypothetical protein [Tamaricihabitans halophyticus]TCP57066.1 hypothetical protein EV191_1011018 [Tamaricihabitans halophyticus]
MATTIPIPVNFRLPDGWQATDPDSVGAAGAAFVALHPESRTDDFTANITINGEYRPDPATLHEIADESVNRLTQVSSQVAVSNRTEVGSPEAPGLTQTLRINAELRGSMRELLQSQVLLAIKDIHSPDRRVVLELGFTATPTQAQQLIEDFQTFVSSVQPVRSEGPAPDNS